ncbi:MAG: hypothetical protein ACRDFR_05150, partial [Candidatus Limnocylindria bacterium]
MTPLRTPAACVISLLLAGTLAACSTSPSAAPSDTAAGDPSQAASAIAPSRGGCDPIDLRAPDGTTLNLTGEWGGGEWFATPGTGERTFILQIGDCVWASITDDQFRDDPQPNASMLAQFSGRLAPDFSISGDLVALLRWVDPFTYGELEPLVPVRLLVEFDSDGRVVLTEDREPGVEGPRCPNPVMWCPAPLGVLVLALLAGCSAGPGGS